MARPKSTAIEERNQRLIEGYRLGHFQSHATLGRLHGMTTQLVYKVLSAAGEGSEDRRKPRILQADRRPLSNFHAILGSTVALYLAGEALSPDRRLKPEPRVFARKLKMSVKHLNGILTGVEDATVSELGKLPCGLRSRCQNLFPKSRRRSVACVRAAKALLDDQPTLPKHEHNLE